MIVLAVVTRVLSIVLTVAVSTYLAYGVILAALGFRVIIRPGVVPPARNALGDAILRFIVDRPTLLVVKSVLEIPARTLSWPIMIRSGPSFADRRSNLQFFAPLALKPNDGQVAVLLFGLVLLVSLLHNAGLAWQPVLTTATWLVLIAVICKEVGYLVSPLPDRLRQASRPPWFTFVLIAVADALALTQAVGNLRAFSQDAPVTVQGWLTSFADLFNVPGNISELMGLTQQELLVAVVGFLYSTSLVKTILSPSHFNRTDDDYRRLALVSVWAGNTSEAARWLGKEKQSVILSHQIRMQIAMVSGQIERAAAAAGRVLVAKEDPDTVDNRLVVIGDAFLLAPVSDEHVVELARYVVTNASDAAASVILPGMLADHPDALEKIADLITEENGPLTYSRVLAGDDGVQSAIAVLDRAQAKSDVEEVLRSLRLCTLWIMDPATDISESRAQVHGWWTASFPTVQKLSAQLVAGDRQLAMSALIELELWLEMVDDESGPASGAAPQEFAPLRQELHVLADDLTDSPEVAERIRSTVRNVFAGH